MTDQDKSVQDMLPTRVSYTSGHVRPHDLALGDVILVDGNWRDVADVWCDGDIEHAISVVGEGSHSADLIRSYLNQANQFVVVRYWIEQNHGSTVTTGVRAYRRPELVTVQVPAGVAPYPQVGTRSRGGRDIQTRQKGRK